MLLFSHTLLKEPIYTLYTVLILDVYSQDKGFFFSLSTLHNITVDQNWFRQEEFPNAI